VSRAVTGSAVGECRVVEQQPSFAQRREEIVLICICRQTFSMKRAAIKRAAMYTIFVMHISFLPTFLKCGATFTYAVHVAFVGLTVTQKHSLQGYDAYASVDVMHHTFLRYLHHVSGTGGLVSLTGLQCLFYLCIIVSKSAMFFLRPFNNLCGVMNRSCDMDFM